MGLFDKLSGHRTVTLTAQGGLLLAAIVMVAIDGDVDDDEVAIIRRLDGSDSTDAWEAALKTYKTKTVSESIQLAAQAMNEQQRLIAMANLVDIAMADGGLADAERQLLSAFVDAFDVDEARVEAIVDVIALKNSKSAFKQAP